MDPLTIAAGATVLASVVQLYNGEKARGASKARLNEIKRLYDSIKPPDYDFTLEDPPELHSEALALPEFSSPMAAPQWNLDKLDRKDLELVDKFVPEVAPLILEEQPQLIEKSPEMAKGLEAQRTALRRFMSIGEGGEEDPQFQQRVVDARRRAQAEAQSRGESIMQDYARRGMGGSGLELAAQIGSSAEAMDRNAMMGLAAEAEAYRNQLNALSQGAALGGQIYAQDQGTQARNADIINAFNQRMSQRYQDWEQARASALNAADLRNINEAQRIADANVLSGNRAAEQERARLDDLTRFNYAAAQGERNRADEQAKWLYGAKGKERAYQDAREVLQKEWRQGNVDRMNQLRDRVYQNQLNKAAGQSGIAQQQSALDIGAAQDRSAAIQGLTNLGMSYAMNQDQKNFQREMRDRDDALYQKYGKGGY